MMQHLERRLTLSSLPSSPSASNGPPLPLPPLRPNRSSNGRLTPLLSPPPCQLANLSAMELHLVRPFFSAALAQFARREAAMPAAAAADADGQTGADVAASNDE